MTRIKTLLAGTAIAFSAVAGQAHASLIFSETLTPVSGDSDTTFFDEDNDFSETFDFSALDILSIDRLELTLVSEGFDDESGSGLLFGFIPFFDVEEWSTRAQGGLVGDGDDIFEEITTSPQTFVYDDAATDVFQTAVDTQTFTVWLAESSSDKIVKNPSITVSSATLEIYGELAPIPVPAALPLGALALGGLGLYARRQRRAARA